MLVHVPFILFFITTIATATIKMITIINRTTTTLPAAPPLIPTVRILLFCFAFIWLKIRNTICHAKIILLKNCAKKKIGLENYGR
jgi:hypothetical protein